ncbi:MAG: two-component sensor histidine kinase [Rhodocyclales bacterium CG17_big_fil_post_rev_8_21_14_2_50_68_7]|nr:MAG: two-component sensor histidine kinase [Rhodocyclales bacterium CG17_big_fil_post_rev_8_21_14_2_50_68_7]
MHSEAASTTPAGRKRILRVRWREVLRELSPRGASLSARYLVVSLLAAIVPLAAAVTLYDRYAADLVLRLADQRVESTLAATASKLGDFLRNKAYQLDGLADFPPLAQIAGTQVGDLDTRLLTRLQVEADSPDVYGILFFDRADRVIAALHGQSAIEPELRDEAGPALAALPRVDFQGVELIGPMLPPDGRPGWFLIRRAIAGQAISVALQVRLASLSELLSGASLDVYRPLLHTPGGRLIEPVGTQWRGDLPLVRAPETAPGWYAALYRVSPQLPLPGTPARYVFIAAAALCGVLIVLIFVYLGVHMRRRLKPLVAAAEAVGRGEFALDIPAGGEDEIAMLARALNRMSAQLRALIRTRVESEKRAVLGEFAASVAHEVRNPLATIKTCVQALGSREEDPARREMMQLVTEEIERINAVIEGLLGFARPHDPERTEVSARELLRRLAALVGPMAEEAHVALSVLGEPELRLWVDAGQTQQILMNLVLNALQATPEGGTITLRAWREAGFACLTVSDTGHGMSDEVAHKVMEPFFTTKPGGTGLGLAVSRQLAEMNGGSIEIASLPASGTTVTLRLPLAREETP